MKPKEARARIKINRLLEDAGWRFFDDEHGKANILLESNVRITKTVLDSFGEDFEKTTKGYVDFLLLDEDAFPLVVLEAKREEKNPLDAKEQARRYAQSLNVRFVILSNGNLHYFWDLEKGNPTIITTFPTPESLTSHKSFQPHPQSLIDEVVDKDYIVLTQKPDYASVEQLNKTIEKTDSPEIKKELQDVVAVLKSTSITEDKSNKPALWIVPYYRGKQRRYQKRKLTEDLSKRKQLEQYAEKGTVKVSKVTYRTQFPPGLVDKGKNREWPSKPEKLEVIEF